MACEHRWEPVPGEMGQYLCEACGAHGQRGWRGGDPARPGWRGGGIELVSAWWRSEVSERAERVVGQRVARDVASERIGREGPCPRWS